MTVLLAVSVMIGLLLCFCGLAVFVIYLLDDVLSNCGPCHL